MGCYSFFQNDGRWKKDDVNISGVVSSSPRLVVLGERFCVESGFLNLSDKFLLYGAVVFHRYKRDDEKC